MGLAVTGYLLLALSGGGLAYSRSTKQVPSAWLRPPAHCFGKHPGALSVDFAQHRHCRNPGEIWQFGALYTFTAGHIGRCSGACLCLGCQPHCRRTSLGPASSMLPSTGIFRLCPDGGGAIGLAGGTDNIYPEGGISLALLWAPPQLPFKPETACGSSDRFPVSPLIRVTLMALYGALMAPLPVLAAASQSAVSPVLLTGGHWSGCPRVVWGAGPDGKDR